eukprot:12917305-Prorocentrum_lima.AAC.1
MGTGVPGAIRPSDGWEWFRIPLKGRANWPQLLAEKKANECYYHGMPFGMLPAFLRTGVLLPSNSEFGESSYLVKNNDDE